MIDIDVTRTGKRSPRSPFWSVRTRLILYFSLAFASVLVLIEAIDFMGVPFSSHPGRLDEQKTDTFRTLGLIADGKKEWLLRAIKERHDDVRVFAREPMLESNVALLRAAAAKLDAANLTPAEVRADLHKETSYRALSDHLHRISRVYGVYPSICIVDARTGRPLVSTDPALLDIDMSREPFFTQALQSGHPFIGNVRFDPGRQASTLPLSQAILDVDPDTLKTKAGNAAVFVMELGADDITKPVLETGERYGATGEALLVDQDGRIVTPLKHPLADGRIAKPLQYRMTSEAARLAAQRQDGIVEAVDYRGVPVLAAYRYVPITSAWGWGLVVKRDQAELAAPIYADISWVIGISAAGILLVIALTVGIARTVTGPIVALSHTADRVSAGDLAARAAVSTSDELGALARTFNAMIAQVQDWHVQLEEQVLARTAELNETNTRLQAEVAERERAETLLRQSVSLLRATLDSTADGILAIDRAGKVMSLNGRFLDMWNLQDVAARSEEGADLLDSAARQLKDPAGFLARVKDLDDHSEAPHFDLLELLDGRVFERYSLPQRIGDQIVGRALSFRDVTDRRRAEEDRARLAAIVDSSDDAIISKNLDGIVTTWNASARRLYGYSAEEMRGRHIATLAPPERAGEAAEITSRIRRGQSVAHFETVRITKDGRLIDVSLALSPIRDSAGAVVGVSIIARDITERKRAEEALRQSEERFRTAVDNFPGIYVIYDARRRIEFINAAGIRACQVPADQMLGRRDEDLFPDEITRNYLSHLQRAVETGQTQWFEMSLSRAGAPNVSYVVTYVPLYDDRGAVCQVLGVMHDITERKQAEEALNESEARYRSLFVFMNEGMALHEILWNDAGEPEDYVLLDVNPSFERLVGITRNQCIGKRATEAYGTSAPPFLDAYARVVKTGGAETFETYFAPLGKHFRISAYSPGGSRFATVFDDITERIRNEEALQASERRYRNLFESMDEGFALCEMMYDPDGKPVDFRYLEVNPAFTRLTGLPVELVVGRPVREVIPGIEPFWIETYARVVQTGVSERVDNPVRALGGHYEVYVWRAGVGQFGAVFIDVTERKRAQQERETTIEFLRLVNEAAGLRELIRAAVTFFQRQSGCQAVGVRLKERDDYPYYEARGFPAEFVLAETSLCSRDEAGDLVRDSDGNPVIECMCGNVICGRFDPAKPFFTPSGSFWTNCTAELLASTPETDRQVRTRNRCNGEGYESVALIPLHVGQERLGLLQLNDPRKGAFSPDTIGLWERLAGHFAVALAKFRADEALRESQADLSRAQIVSHTGSWRMDMRRNELLLSDEGCRIFEISAGRALAYDGVLAAVHPEDREFVAAVWQAALRAEPFDIENRIVVGDVVKWVRVRAELELDEHRVLIGAFGIIQDITDRKRAEQERERFGQVLAEKNKELEELIYATSHDLRSPLVNIYGFSQELAHAAETVCAVLRGAGLPEALRLELVPVLERDIPEAIRYIHSGTAKMDALLSGLLRISRLGRAALDIQSLDMNAIIAEIVRSMEYQIKVVGADVQVDDLPPCFGDAAQINQVFSNLLDNATKYLDPARPGRIHITARAETGRVVYCVADNGVGISPAHREKVFELFHRAATAEVAGEGLGLAIAQRVVRRHNGAIWVEAEPGKGSRFFVSLPAQEARGMGS